MSAGIQSIALFAPIVASNAIFSARRASRGVDAVEENPFYAAANIDIAAGQVVKGGRAAKAIAIATDENTKIFTSADEAIKKLSKSNKLVNGACKVVKFTANNINPIICVTSGIKVLGSDDKIDTAARESLALITMFAAEKGAKELIGMPGLSTDKNGNTISEKRVACFKQNPFLAKQSEAIKDYCNTKKLFNKYSLKALPGAMKGLAFVSASIMGYKLGTELGNAILGEQKQA